MPTENLETKNTPETDKYGNEIVTIKDFDEVPKTGKRTEKKVYKLEDNSGKYMFFGN